MKDSDPEILNKTAKYMAFGGFHSVEEAPQDFHKIMNDAWDSAPNIETKLALIKSSVALKLNGEHVLTFLQKVLNSPEPELRKAAVNDLDEWFVSVESKENPYFPEWKNEQNNESYQALREKIEVLHKKPDDENALTESKTALATMIRTLKTLHQGVE